jgi:cytochrome c oxidase assembly factor CtaG
MVFALCALIAVCYWLGGRRPLRLIPSSRSWGVRQWKATAFGAGLAIVLIVLSEPVDAILRRTLWGRTVQLVSLLMLASPLLVLAAPFPRFMRLFDAGAVRRKQRPPKATALLAFLLFNGGLVLAYVPSVVSATASPGWNRQLSQLLTIGVGVFFWSEVIAQAPLRCPLSQLERIVYLLLSSTLIRILGLVLGFASVSFYSTTLADQQIAAGLLLVPGVLTDLIVLTVCLYLWLGQDARRAQGGLDTGGRALPVMQQRLAR